jgi:hypothetical protein
MRQQPRKKAQEPPALFLSLFVKRREGGWACELGQWILNSGKRTRWRLSLRLLLIPLLPLHAFTLFMGKRCSHFSFSLSLSRMHIFVVFNMVGGLICFVFVFVFFFRQIFVCMQSWWQILLCITCLEFVIKQFSAHRSQLLPMTTSSCLLMTNTLIMFFTNVLCNHFLERF